MRKSFFMFVLFGALSFGVTLPSFANFDEFVSFGYWSVGCHFNSHNDGKSCMAHTDDTKPTKNYPSAYKGLTFSMIIQCDTEGALAGGYFFSHELTLAGKGTEGVLTTTDLATSFGGKISQVNATQLLKNQVAMIILKDNTDWLQSVLDNSVSGNTNHAVAIPTRELGDIIVEFDLLESDVAIFKALDSCGGFFNQ